MSIFSVLVEKLTPKRPMYLQVGFTVLAFLMMVALSHLFMSDMVHSYLVRHAQNVLTFERLKIEAVLREPEVTLDGFSQTVRHLIMRGADLETLKEYVADVSEHLTVGQTRILNLEEFHGYFETLTGEAAYIDGKARPPI